MHLAKNFVNYMKRQRGPQFEECLNQLRLLGEAEIQASSKVDLPSNCPRLLHYHEFVKRQINPSWIQSFLDRREKEEQKEAKLVWARSNLKTYIQKFQNEIDLLHRHILRLNLMMGVANDLLEIGCDTIGFAEAEYIVRQRKARLLEHRVVLKQAVTAYYLLINNTLNAVDLIDNYNSTHMLAKKVRNSVRALSNGM